MNIEEIHAIMKEKAEKAEVIQWNSKHKIHFKWEISPDIMETMKSTYNYPNIDIHDLYIYSYPIDINYDRSKSIKLWGEIQ